MEEIIIVSHGQAHHHHSINTYYQRANVIGYRDLLPTIYCLLVDTWAAIVMTCNVVDHNVRNN